ncbi:YjiH family protein [Fusibacter sp. JL298sf-3]
MSTKQNKWLYFILPSLLGVLLFMVPFKLNGEMTIVVAFLAGVLKNFLSEWMSEIILAIATFSFVYHLAKASYKKDFLWTIVKGIGIVFIYLTYFNIGPEFLISENTGGLLFNDLLSVLFVVFLFAGFFLPLLVEFGLLEYIGAMFSRFMRPIFTLPGRSAIDCMTSWLGDGTIGVLLTSKQYEENHYTLREAAVIGTTFSAVSITFSLVVLSQVGLERYFAPYYLTIILVGVVAAIIMPRIAPLKNKKDIYFNGDVKGVDTEGEKEHLSHKEAFELASNRGYTYFKSGQMVKDGLSNVKDMWLNVLPIVMALGTLGLVVAEYTPVFTYLGMPIKPLLDLLQIPEAAAAAPTFVIGFADMFLPSVLATSLNSDLTKFVIAGVSVTQLIYMSEVGALLIASKIPVNFKDLLIIFIERTLISLPLFALVAHILF